MNSAAASLGQVIDAAPDGLAVSVVVGNHCAWQAEHAQTQVTQRRNQGWAITAACHTVEMLARYRAQQQCMQSAQIARVVRASKANGCGRVRSR
ncbi:hypothetical protein NC77_14325 [Janthinobacterium lividum]|nr:hypothetical protein NC77_14325 [Janthinobacterium lividum]